MHFGKTVGRGLLAVLLATLVVCERSEALAQSRVDESNSVNLSWIAFPDKSKIKVCGLFWFEENAPKLWRLPAKEMASLPKGVQERSKCSSGGRLLLKCTSAQVAIKVTQGSLSGFNVYVNGRAVPEKKAAEEERVVVFGGLGNEEKEIVIYLPHSHEVAIEAIGVDAGTMFSSPEHSFAGGLPIVFYGSSVCQGSGATKAAMTYEAIACRELNVDFVNLGFGGAGKAESNVVALVNSITASCYVFDLGKSYGAQDSSAFQAMLRAVRKAHPQAPIVCITPITSAREIKDASYSERSVHTRKVMRSAVRELCNGGDMNVILIEGEELLGFKEHAGLSKDGVHPSDKGYEMMAKKLVPVLKQAIGL